MYKNMIWYVKICKEYWPMSAEKMLQTLIDINYLENLELHHHSLGMLDSARIETTPGSTWCAGTQSIDT